MLQVSLENATSPEITVKVEVGESKRENPFQREYEEKTFKVTDKTTVAAVKGDNKTEIKAEKVSVLLQKEQFKTGTYVNVEPDTDGQTAKTISIGESYGRVAPAATSLGAAAALRRIDDAR